MTHPLRNTGPDLSGPVRRGALMPRHLVRGGVSRRRNHPTVPAHPFLSATLRRLMLRNSPLHLASASRHSSCAGAFCRGGFHA